MRFERWLVESLNGTGRILSEDLGKIKGVMCCIQELNETNECRFFTHKDEQLIVVDWKNIYRTGDSEIFV